MKRVGLIGAPLAHSLSPALHSAAFQAQGLDWRYQLLEVGPEHLAGRLEQLRDEPWVGFNVTLPHKVQVMRHLDRIDEAADGIGAVNTVVRRGRGLVGLNTDAAGLLRDLERLAIPVKERRVLLLGAGGAARAVAWALAGQGCAVTIVARRKEQADELVNAVPQGMRPQLTVRSWQDETFASAPDEALVVNGTPVGMWPRVNASPWPADIPLPSEGAIYDLVYRPHETALVRRAREAGLEAHGGLGMLVEQAALGNEQWTGMTAPREKMWRAASAALEVV